MEMDEFDSNYAMALSLSYGTWTCTNPDDFINVDKESLSLKLQQPTYVAGTR